MPQPAGESHCNSIGNVGASSLVRSIGLCILVHRISVTVFGGLEKNCTVALVAYQIEHTSTVIESDAPSRGL